MATEHLSMSQARRRFAGQLVRFGMCLRDGLSPAEAAAEIRVGAETADLYADTLRQLLQLAANTVHPMPGLDAIRSGMQTAPEAPGAATNTHTHEGNQP